MGVGPLTHPPQTPITPVGPAPEAQVWRGGRAPCPAGSAAGDAPPKGTMAARRATLDLIQQPKRIARPLARQPPAVDQQTTTNRQTGASGLPVKQGTHTIIMSLIHTPRRPSALARQSLSVEHAPVTVNPSVRCYDPLAPGLSHRGRSGVPHQCPVGFCMICSLIKALCVGEGAVA